MEIHQIRYFLEVYRNKSFTKAAKECHVSQPSLSAQIQKLESELRGPLFLRARGGILLTNRGELFLPRAIEIEHQTEKVREEMEQLDGLTRGRVRLGCLPTTGAYVLPEILAYFHDTYPGIRVELWEESSPGLARALLGLEIDGAILDEAGLTDGLVGETLFTEPLYLAVPPDHRLSGAGVVALSSLAEEPIILMKQGHGFSTIVRRALEDAGVTPRVVYESAEIETVQGLVAAGLGISLVPRMIRKAWGVAYLEIAPPTPSRTLIFAYRAGTPRGPAAVALGNSILQLLRRDIDRAEGQKKEELK
ncbi:MAG: LysR family transcriptional regulator [Spirochaetales bacterium]|nr:LysR family transcriptional regulator [Spirochaetales bacterium]